MPKICVVCGKQFLITSDDYRTVPLLLRKPRRRKNSITCSRTCSKTHARRMNTRHKQKVRLSAKEDIIEFV